MSREIPKEVKKLMDLYDKSRLVRYCAADEYQYHQNQLTKGLAEFILKDYFEVDKEKSEDA